MSKVTLLKEVVRDTFAVSNATVSTGWKSGQGFSHDSTGNYAQLGITDDVLFIGMDSDTELSAPPTGSLLTGIYGSGTTILIDHTSEVAASDATRVYNTSVGNPESGAINQNLYFDATGKWTTNATGSVKGKLITIPSSGNNYTLGLISRF